MGTGATSRTSSKGLKLSDARIEIARSTKSRGARSHLDDPRRQRRPADYLAARLPGEYRLRLSHLARAMVRSARQRVVGPYQLRPGRTAEPAGACAPRSD